MAIMFEFSTILLVLLFIVGLVIPFYTLKSGKTKTTKECPECEEEISSDAKICPNCGYPFKEKKHINKKEKRKILIKKIILWIYQIVCGIGIVCVFEWSDKFISELLILIALILNTITLIIFNIIQAKRGKKLSEKISVISILAILCGLAFSFNYTLVLINNVELGYDEDIREIMYLETYTKEEAEKFLDNIYYALRKNDQYTDNVELYGIWVDNEKSNEYYANFRAEGAYLPPNAMKIVVNPNDKTKVERIYWQFNKDEGIEIDFYKDGKQVEDFLYVYNCALMGDEPMYPIKELFEEEVKDKLKSPSSAIFTYDGIRYSTVDKRFKIYGLVESQNSFGAMVRTDFIITFKPCNNEDCEWYGLDYTWTFNK